MGPIPQRRKEFQPELLLEKIENGDKVKVIDSEKHLPKNWQQIDLKEEYGHLVERSKENENLAEAEHSKDTEKENLAEATNDCNNSL